MITPRTIWRRLKSINYNIQYEKNLKPIHTKFGARRILPCTSVTPKRDHLSIWSELRRTIPDVKYFFASLDTDFENLKSYRNQFSELYRYVGNSEEKAIEHALTFELMDIKKGRRHCDVAASASPIAVTMKKKYPHIEFWKQDLIFKTDFDKKTIGGFAQDMQGIPDGYFDSMTLHCSFEHFTGTTDSEFIKEVDRVLSPKGTCLILPLYLDTEPKIFFDPTHVALKHLENYDPEALLCPTYQYRQEHGRFYSPETLRDRVISKLPKTLGASLIRFDYDRLTSPTLYLCFGLALHRQASLFNVQMLTRES